MQDSFFRVLSPEEEEEFRQYARTTDPPNRANWEIYHPVCREEWRKRGIFPSVPIQGKV